MMWIGILTFLLVLFEVPVGFSQLPLMESGQAHVNPCEEHCEEKIVRPVCGSDAKTYRSICDLKKANCEGVSVKKRHNGRCTDTKKCFAQREEAKLQEDGTSTPIFIPQCKVDGAFEEVQCFNDYCWCVDVAGKNIPGSSVQNSRPNCRVKNAGRNTRRSSRGRKEKKGCNAADRNSMNSNILEIFRTEYSRFNNPPPTAKNRQIVQWKFTELDTNKDDYLKKNELRDLKRMAKKIVKPKQCARIFTKYCDTDGDKKISRMEWSICLGVNLNNEQVGDPDDPTSMSDNDRKPPIWKQPPGIQIQENPMQIMVFEDNDFQDCRKARKNAIEDPNTGVFMPDCAENGLYKQVQCHAQESSPDYKYCWCVNVATGNPIAGTTTVQDKPNCNSARRNSKSFKGCSYETKRKFMDEFLIFIVNQMTELNKNKYSKSDAPTKESAAEWKFDNLDVNKNKMLDRKEWISFRQQWKIFQQNNENKNVYRKCWRNLPKFCDDDNDSKVNLQEWLKCTGVGKGRSTLPPWPRTPAGPNPLETILKSE